MNTAASVAVFFRLADAGSSIRRELVAGATTFLAMAYIIFVEPAVLSGTMFGTPTGMDFGAVTTATCLAAALATAVMGLVARYPIALAPGMGQNFFFTVTVLPVAAASGSAEPWATALGAVFVAGLLFLGLTVLGIREKVMDIVSLSMKFGIAAGIGLFIALIGLRNAQVVLIDPGTAVKMNARIMSPDIVVFLAGFVVAAGLHARRVVGSIIWGVAAALAAALILKILLPLLPLGESPVFTESLLATRFTIASGIMSMPPSLGPTFLQMDVVGAFTSAMIPMVIILLFMDVFDTMGTLIGVGEQAGMMREGRLPRVERAMLADAVGTVAGAALGTSTVTSYVESAAGVEQGGKTGLTALTVSALFLVALVFYPLVAMIGSYPSLTAPALVLVGAMMVRNVVKIDWADYTEAVPAFLVVMGIPFFYNIADGIAVGLIVYPLIKTVGGRGREVSWGGWVVTALLVVYFIAVRSRF